MKKNTIIFMLEKQQAESGWFLLSLTLSNTNQIRRKKPTYCTF